MTSQSIADLTIAEAFLRTVRAHGAETALRWRSGDDWGSWTYDEYADRVARAAGALRERGVQPRDRVVLMMRNIPEFHVLDLAVLVLGATPVSIYNSSAPDQIEYLVGHSGAVLGVVEDDSFLSRFEPVRSALPALRGLGVVRPGERAADFTWDDLMAGEPIDLEAAAAATTPDSLATVIYTSGTTGPPKGVMISHANVMFLAQEVRSLIPIEDLTGMRIVSYLPMAHIAERSVSHYLQVAQGCEVVTCPSPSDIASYLRDVRPHFVFGVPRVWEKIHAGVSGALAADPDKAAQFAEAVEAAKPIVLRKAWGEATDEDHATYGFLDDVAFRGVRELLGLDECLVAITGAAPIPPDLLMWFQAIGVPLSEIYGMSENAGAMTWAPMKIKPGTVGPAVPGTEVRIADDGEVICRGPHVFQGYLDDPEKTAEALSPDGWLHTGDIGEFDDDGYLKITDRKKDIIVLSGGDNVAPARVEGFLILQPEIAQAMVHGDKHPHIVALIVPDPDFAAAWAKQQGAPFDMERLARDSAFHKAIGAAVDRVNASISPIEKIRRFAIAAEAFTIDNAMLTPSLKIRRHVIKGKYGELLAKLYERG